MINQPLVSVIIAIYNNADCIKRAIKSVLIQTYKNFELIIVDDGSSDNLKEIIKPFLGNKVFYLRQKNQGAAAARNWGIKNSRGKYIAILDSDDFWCDKSKIEKQINFLENNPKYVLTGGGVIKVNSKGKEISRYLTPENDEEIRKLIFFKNCFAHSTTVFRRKSWQRAGGYNKDLDGLEDYDLWLKMSFLGKLYNFQFFWVCYRDHDLKNPNYLDKKYSKIKQLKLNLNLRWNYIWKKIIR